MRIANEMDEGNIVFIVCDDGWKYLSSGHLHAARRGDREPGLHRLVVITRRALVAAGAGVLLVGCGADAEPRPADAELLGAVLALERALVARLRAVPGALGRDLGAARERRSRRACATPALRRRMPFAPGSGVEAALSWSAAAWAPRSPRSGSCARPAIVTLTADAMKASAQHAAILLDRLGRDPLETAFPDGRQA